MDCIRTYIENNLSEKRKKHTYAVCGTAVELALFYGVDKAKAETAALFHDIFRDAPDSALTHGKTAADAMSRDYGISDEDILNAVRYHTTGRAGMSLLEKIIFLADAIEPGRDYQGVEKIRALAYKDLNGACALSMNGTIEYVRSSGLYLDDDTIRARDFLIKGGNE